MPDKIAYKSSGVVLLVVGVVCFLLGFLIGNKYSSKRPPLISQNDNITQRVSAPAKAKAEVAKAESKVTKALKTYKKEKTKDTADVLLGSYGDLAMVLAKHKDIDKLADVLKKGAQLEKDAGITSGEKKIMGLLEFQLIDKWIHTDGDMLLRYLRSPNVSMEDKMNTIDNLKEMVEKKMW